MKNQRILLMLLLTIFLMGTLDLLGQNYQATSEMPKVLQQAYKPRVKVIHEDTVVYRHRWFMPDQYKLQYAGSIGFISVGFGYEFGKIYHPALFFGYVGPTFGGSENGVFTVSLKNSFLFTRQPLFNHLVLYGGLSINWGNTNNTFRTLPDYYPDKYYFQNMVHFAPFLGSELKFILNGKYFKGIGVYTELSAFDAYLLEAIRTKYVKPHMAMSLAFGVTMYLK